MGKRKLSTLRLVQEHREKLALQHPEGFENWTITHGKRTTRAGKPQVQQDVAKVENHPTS